MADDTRVLRNMVLQLEKDTKESGVQINIEKTEVMRINDREIIKVKTKEGEKYSELISADICEAC